MSEFLRLHPDLTAERWGQFSLAEQLANVGSEVGRMVRWRERDGRLMTRAFDRALELLDLTLADPRWRDRLREIARIRELLCAAALGEPAYATTLEDLDRYLYGRVSARRAHTTRRLFGSDSCPA